MRERVAAVLSAAALLAGCEPAVDLSVPPREPGQVALDRAAILDANVEQRLRAFGADGIDVVALTYESEQAGRGEANRAGKLLLREWGADIALVAVARPGDFASGAAQRERFFGLEAADAYDVPRGLREDIVETLVPPVAGENDWSQAFIVALDQLHEGL
jgi:hypothetical protein